MGLSERRAEWLCDWISSLEKRKEVTDLEFAAGLGRLSFASLALPWERPLLGPLFAWSAAVRGTKGSLRIPWVVLFILGWIREKLGGGLNMEEVRPPLRGVQKKELRIWTDAKATETTAWIGGWCQTDPDLKRCEWFSEEVTEKMAPWLYMKNRDPKRVIASLEMLATLVAVKLWLRNDGMGMRIHTEAFTDNKGNEFILKKGMSTKFPITLLVIEMGETLRLSDATADLIWVRRDENQEADDLTNEEFKKFAMEKRILVTEENCRWVVLDKLLPMSERLYTELQEFKKKKSEEKKSKGTILTKNKKKSGGAKYFGRWHS
eukprot:Skav225114  [mRNA]  locus=scaffold1459:76340:77299:+ [translate_table: standard]